MTPDEQLWRLVRERNEARDEVERITRQRDEARAALKPFASLFLWPDDLDSSSAADIRADEDWSEPENDARSATRRYQGSAQCAGGQAMMPREQEYLQVAERMGRQTAAGRQAIWRWL